MAVSPEPARTFLAFEKKRFQESLKTPAETIWASSSDQLRSGFQWKLEKVCKQVRLVELHHELGMT